MPLSLTFASEHTFIFQNKSLQPTDLIAGNRDSLAEILCCVVCLEDYEADDSLIPRLLPCSHTLCERCVNDLIKDNKLMCPECRKKHEATKGEKSFPQNKYLLVQIRKKKNDAKDEEEDQNKERCEEHGKEKEKENLTREVMNIMQYVEARVDMVSFLVAPAAEQSDLSSL